MRKENEIRDRETYWERDKEIHTDRWLSKSKTWHRVSSEESSYLDLRGLSQNELDVGQTSLSQHSDKDRERPNNVT